MFRKVLVANRGEIARRIIRACHAVGAQAVAVYSAADANAPYLREADEALCIGPAPAAQSYLNQDAILEAALQADAQAIHPGFGFLSENARFAARCAQQRLTFVGPSARAISLMGDKATARRTMADLGVPILPGTRDTLRSLDEAATVAQEVGYPLLLKATAGGGGKGMRRVNGPDDLAPAFHEASREAERAFGDGGLYVERYVVGGRHIEFQILGDTYGHVIHLGERECSIQRNHQKLLEEAPAPNFDPTLRAEMGARLCAALARLGYVGAGTVEFLMDDQGRLYFMEMNTRIQVEHPVTELVTGVDLVAWQLKIAAGQRLTLSQADITLRGHAIECRINAEDPTQGFRPSPGLLTRFDVPADGPQGPVRLDTHAEVGYRIPSQYDSMIGKLITWGEDRFAALTRLRAALAAAAIEGVPTTLGLHRAIAQHPTFSDGRYNCQFLFDHPEVLSASAG
jgi:acetyl-CoA carboxylase biotin carboxylase subunit